MRLLFMPLAILTACAGPAFAQPGAPAEVPLAKLRLLLLDPAQDAAVVETAGDSHRLVTVGESLFETGWRVRSVLDDHLLLEELRSSNGPPRLLRLYTSKAARRLGLEHPWQIIEPGTARQPDTAPTHPRPSATTPRNDGD